MARKKARGKKAARKASGRTSSPIASDIRAIERDIAKAQKKLAAAGKTASAPDRVRFAHQIQTLSHMARMIDDFLGGRRGTKRGAPRMAMADSAIDDFLG